MLSFVDVVSAAKGSTRDSGMEESIIHVLRTILHPKSDAHREEVGCAFCPPVTSNASFSC